MQDLTEEIENTVNLLLQTQRNSKERQKQKLLDKGKTVYLQVALFKIPFVSSRKRKFIKLCHSLYGDDPEICLFVPNRKTGADYKKTTEELIDFCVDYYTGILEKHKIRGVTTVMPLKQLKSEYGSYELRRNLVRRFDLFLCKNSLLHNSRFLTSLGKIFKVANKEPLGVPFPKEDVSYDPDFQKNINRAIFTTSFYISRFSDNYSIPFGSLSNTKVELKENLQAVLNQISNEEIIPGGFENIRAMYLWPSQSKPVPLYISSELPVNMKRPHLKIKRKRTRGVEGELSTQPHKKVFVAKSGDVFVTNLNPKESEVNVSEDDESFQDESDCDDDIDNDDNGGDKKKENSKSNFKIILNEEESESENDKEIEQQETKLLEKKWRTESNPLLQKTRGGNSKIELEDNLKKKKKKIARIENGRSEVKKKKENLLELNKRKITNEKKGNAKKALKKMKITGRHGRK